MLQGTTQRLWFIHQHDNFHPCQPTFSPEGSSAAVSSVGQDSRDLWRWLIASNVALCTALIRSSVILPPYRFCTPTLTAKIQYQRCVYKANFPKQIFHLRDWLQWLQMPEELHAARSNKKGLVFSHISTSCRIISEIVLNSVLCNDKVFLYLLPNLWPLEPKVAAAKGWLCEPAEAFAVGSWSGSGAISFVPPGLPAGLDKDSSRQLLLVLSCP